MENQLLLDGYHKNKNLSQICDPQRVFHRIIILCLTCLITFGSYFCYDNPSALQKVFVTELKMTQTSYMSLYAWYAWPNIIMSFLGGFLIDNMLGIRLGTILFGLLTIFGQVLLSVGVYIEKLWLMDLARFIFGIGAESLAVAQNTYAAKWFKDKELNIVFGLQISISRLGSTLNSNTMQNLYNKLNEHYAGKNALSLSLLIASLTCIGSFIFCCILGYLDKRADKLCLNRLTHVTEPIKFKDIFKFEISLWALCIICITFYSSVFPFISLAQTFIIQKYQMTISRANLANSLIYLVSAIVSPIFGFGVDFIGKNLIWLSIGMIILFMGHVLIAFTLYISPFFITILIGIAYSMVASSLWGLVTYVVPKSRQGTAFGLMQALMNLGLGIVALVSGSLVDNFGYFILELFFICLILLGIVTLLYVFIWDIKHLGILNASKSQRRKFISEE